MKSCRFANAVGPSTVAYSNSVAGRTGCSTLAYLWFMAAYHVFFVSFPDGLPLGPAAGGGN
jgi:hypothetical protein